MRRMHWFCKVLGMLLWWCEEVLEMFQWDNLASVGDDHMARACRRMRPPHPQRVTKLIANSRHALLGRHSGH